MAFISLSLVLPQSVHAASNDTVNLQGKIVIKSSGVNVVSGTPSCVSGGADTCDFRVRYYDAATAGTLLAGEEFTNVEIGDYKGIFKLVLGSGSFTGGSESTFSAVFVNHASVYAEIGFDPAGGSSYSETFLSGSNRMQVRAVPYAIAASKVAWSGLTDPTGNLTLNHGTNTTTFNFANVSTTGFTQTFDSLTSGTGLAVTSSATASTSNLANFELTGSNSSNTGNVLRAAISGTSSLSTALMVTNLGGGTSFRVNDQTGDTDSTPFIITNSGDVGIGNTAPGTTLDVTGTGRFSSTLTASNGLTLTTGALSVTGTSGSIALTGYGTTSITSTTATGAINSFIDNSITSGTVLNTTSTSNGVTSGGLSVISLTQSAATGTTVNGNIAGVSFSPTYSTAITTPTISGNVSNISRSVTTNSSFASTLTVSGAVASISDAAVQTTGTLTSTADVLRISQAYANNSGSVLNIGAGGGSSGFALRVNDDGTFTDSTPFVIDNAGSVGIQNTAPGTTLDVTGTGRFSSTLTASNGLTLTTGALNLTATSGSIALTGYGTTSITSTTATGAINSFIDNSITSGTVLNATSTSNGLTSGGLLNLAFTQSAATGTTVNGNIAGISFAPTYSTAITTPTISGNTLNVSRSVTTNSSFASTLTLSGSVASISDAAVQTTGTLTSTADVLRLSQAYTNNSGSVLNIAAGGGSSGFGLRVNDDGTFTDSTPFVIDNAGSVGIQNTAPGTTLDVTGTGRFSSTLTASNGFTQTTGALSLIATSGSIALTGFGTSSVTSTTNTGNIFTIADTSFAVAGTATGNLANLTFTNTSVNTSNTATTTGLNIAATNNAVGSGGTQETYGIRIQALAGTSGAGTQNNYGIRIGNQGLASTEASYGLYIDSQTGSTASYAAVFAGGNVGIGNTAPGALLDLGLAGTTSGALRFAGSTSGNVTVNTNVAAGTWTFTLPTTAGTNNYVLKTDGSGVTTWVAQTGGGGGSWDVITDPGNNLTLNHGTYTTTFNFTNTTGTAFTQTYNSLTSGTGFAVTSSATAATGTLANFEITGSNAANTGVALRSAVSGTSSLATALMVTNLGGGTSFRVNDQTGDADTTPFVIDNAGQVGIGTATPNAALHVAGNLSIFGQGEGGTPTATTIRGAAASGTDIAGALLTFDASNGTGAGGSGDINFRTAGTETVVVNTNNISTGIAAAANPITFSHTIAPGANRLLIVQITVAATSDPVTSVTYGTQALTLKGVDDGAGLGPFSAIWYLVAPDIGTNTITVNFSGTQYAEAGAIDFTGVNQSTPLGTFASSHDSAGSSPATLTVTGATGDIIVDVLSQWDNSGDASPDSPQVQLWHVSSDGAWKGYGSSKAGAASVNMSWTLAHNAAWSLSGVAVKSIAGSTTANTLVERLRISKSGFVGIAASTPGALLDIGTAGTTAGLFRLAGSTSGNVSVTTAAAAGTWTLTLPTSGGTNNFVLQTNGSGVTSWVAQGGSLEWSSLIDPSTDLTLNHGTNLTTFNFATTSGDGFTNNFDSLTSGTGFAVTSSATAATGKLANFELTGSNAGNTGIVLRAAVSGTSSLSTALMVTNLGGGNSFRVNDQTGDADTSPFIIDTSGNVGIANTAPGALLDLGLAGTTGGVMRLAGSTSGNVTINTNATAGTWTLTLPTTDGNPNEVLQTNGSGVLSWVAQSGGSGAWSDLTAPTASLTLSHSTFTTTFNFANTTTTAFTNNFNNVTTGTGLSIGTASANTLTSGTIFSDTSTATSITTAGAGKGSLATFDWSPGSAASATGDLFAINIGTNGSTTGNLFSVSDTGTALFTVSENNVVASVPVAFTAPGDVSLAYDLVFTNQTGSAIDTNSPFTLDVGENFESNNLTFKTYNQGSVVVDSSVTTGIAFNIPSTTLTTGTLVSLTDSAVVTTTGSLLNLTANSATTATGLFTVNATGLTTGAAIDINVNNTNILTSGSAITVDGPTGAAAISANSGLVKIVATGALTTTTGAGSGGLLDIQANATITGTLASISDTAIMTGTGKLLALTANAATTTTGLLTVNATGLTTGSAVDINVAGNNSLTSGGGLSVTGNTGAAAISANGGLVQLVQAGAFTTSAGSGGVLDIIANGTISGTIASISDTAVMTTTGNLLSLTANAATTTTGLLTINASGLTTGYATNLNVNGTTALTSGGAINVVGPTGAAAISANSGLVLITAAGALTTTTGAGSGALLDVQGNAILSGTLASISDTAVMKTTGKLLDLTANAATTTTGLLTINASGLTTGYAANINANGAAVLTSGGALNIVGPTGAAAISANSGLVKISATGAFTTSTGAGSGGLLNVTANAVISGTIASISDTAVMTTTGNLLTLTANAATTTTGLLTLNSAGLTTGYSMNINANGAAVLTSGGALNIVGPTGAAAISANSGLVKITAAGAFTTQTGAGSGGLLNVTANAVISGTVASISDTAVMTTTGNLLSLTANAATTATGLLTINGTGLTTGSALAISAGTGFAINIVSTGSKIDFASATAGNTMVIRVPTNTAGQGTCATAQAEGVIVQNSGGTQIGRLACVANGTTQLTMFAQAFTGGSTDLAEMYSTRLEDNLVAGDVVSMDTSGNLMLTRSTKPYDPRLMGVISDSPSFAMSGISEADGSADTVNGQYVALKGRVPLRVTTENGPIAVGDYLTSSSTPGAAMKATGRGFVLGQALDAYNGAGEGTIRLYVSSGWYDPRTDAGKTEAYSVEPTVEVGDIVVPGTNFVTTVSGQAQAKLTKATASYQDSVVGVVVHRELDFDANEFAVSDNAQPVAISGRVAVKIDPLSNPILAGDPITTSEAAGKALKAIGTGAIIGKSLVNWTPESGETTILISLDLSFFTPNRLLLENMLADYEAGTLGGTGGGIGQSGGSHWTVDQYGNLTTVDNVVVGNIKATVGLFDTLIGNTLDIGEGNFTVDASGNVSIKNNLTVDGDIILTKTETSNWLLVPANGHVDYNNSFGFNPTIVGLQKASDANGTNQTTRGLGVDYYYEFPSLNQIRVFNTTNQSIYVQVTVVPVN